MAPVSTYRLQLTGSFNLDAAADLTGYLRALGAGAVYCSPLLASADGSTHGYDVVDPRRVDAPRGGEAGWRALVAAARVENLQIVVDVVPNHLGVEDAAENPAWWALLRDGPASPYSRWFDTERGARRILIPVLGDDADLDRDLAVVDGELRYFEHRYPLASGSEGGTPAQIHALQHYELVNFRRADTEQNYRRFFAVSTLAGLRVEDADVFEATHREVLRWVADGTVDGLRIDHPDGLVDPGGYLARLRAAAPLQWIVVEKILEPGERLPAWPVEGTTGYDALREVADVLIDPDAADVLDRDYRKLTGDQRSFAEHAAAGKRLVATTILRAEVNRLARLVPDVAATDDALTELLVAFPVYRSYLPDGAENLAAALATVRRQRPDLTDTLDRLAPRLADPDDELCARFQQTSGAVMAKGVEDTAYYRYNRFIASNEVGGDPGRLGAPPAEFHAAQQRRQAAWPASMTTLSTHDTKRGEDVRARLYALAEFPDEWRGLVTALLDQAPVPNRVFGYLLWQTLVGVGFIERERMHAYAEKAMREAHDGTQWIDPDAAFEDTVHLALDTVYDDREIRARVQAFVDRLTPFGWTTALSQKLIQLTMPGVPDVYQGTELWEDSLVDPDNRRPVDFAARRRTLAALDAAGSLPAVDASGAAKLWLVSRALRLRRDRPDLFIGYQPVPVTGSAAAHAVAFDRGGSLTVATRLPRRLEQVGGWGDAMLRLEGAYTDVLTGRSHKGDIGLREVLDRYPVALLARG